MNFDYPGYDLRFIQRSRCTDGSAHQYTYIYKFYSPVTAYHYIVRAEYHRGNVFAIKFYCKKDRKSEFKYSKIVNRGDLGNVIMSCAKVIPLLLKKHPRVSFCFAASRSIDKNNNTIEDYAQTQRFRLYQYMIPIKFGVLTFGHFAYDVVSSYLLYNKKTSIPKSYIEETLKDTYQTLAEVNL